MELTVSLAVFMIIAVSALALFTALVNSALVAERQAVALTLATNQMEYLKSLPYDSLAIAGGSIYSTSPLPSTSTKKINGISYTIRSSISYADEAYDGCADYPTLQLKTQYCRNYPPPAGAPSPDPNPQDYKLVHVSVLDSGGLTLADVDTEISARVSETASTTGAMFVNVLDDTGNPVSGATVSVVDSTVSPAVNLADSTDTNGIAIFYGLPVDTNNFDYTVSASKSGYSSLSTIVPSGTLQPTYPSLKVLSQQSSYVSLTIKQQGSPSLLIETTATSGAVLPNVKVYAKGGYKRYTDTTNTQYYYDNMTPSDARPTTDASGITTLSNLDPGDYTLCGDAGATSCTIGATTYYLAAAVPYGGPNPFNPVTVPTYDPSNPPTTTFPYNSNNYLQKVRLMLTTVSSFPRVRTLSPDDASIASGTLSSFAFTINGTNLPCSATAASCNTTVSFTQGANNFPASCTGSSAGLRLNCTVNLSSAIAGSTRLVVTANGGTLTLPDTPLLGGIVVRP